MSTKPVAGLAPPVEAQRAIPNYWSRILGLLAILAFVLPSLLWLDTSPPPWWDEGWTLLVARHAVEDNFYGRMPFGGPEGPGLAAAIPTQGLVVLSFKLFGIGVWQGRLPSLILTALGLVLLHTLSSQLFNQRVAHGAIGLLLLCTPHLATNPIFVAREVLAEPIQLCTLLGGYLAFLAAGRRPGWIWVAPVLWGLGLLAKAQTLPFWVASLMLPLALAVLRRQWRPARVLAACMVGSWAIMRGLNWLITAALAPHTAPSTELVGLTSALALVVAPSARAMSTSILLIAGMPAVLGVTWAGWRALRSARRIDLDDRLELVHLMVLVLAGSWLAWYGLLSIGWARYAYPAIFVAAPFAGALFARWTEDFRLPATLTRLSAALRARRPQMALGPFSALLLIMLLVPLTIWQLYGSFTERRDDSLYRAATFLHATSPDSVIESYESELLALVRRPYHYPPDMLNLLYIQQGSSADPASFGYDPLVADPDYLVVGVMGKSSGLYASALATGQFHAVARFGPYSIYERARSSPGAQP
jgi:hypothetical protein